MLHSRLERVAELLREAISDILRMVVHDPRIGFVTITEVKVTPDLRECFAYVSVYGSKEVQNDTMAGLQSSADFIRGELNKRVRLRFIPKLQFIFDSRVESANKVLQLLDSLNNSRTGEPNLISDETENECERIQDTNQDLPGDL